MVAKAAEAGRRRQLALVPVPGRDGTEEGVGTMGWIAPTVYYVVAVGALGVTSKLALRTLTWQDLILWSGLGYVLVSTVLLASGQTSLRFGSGSGWAASSAALAITGLVALYLALNSGKAGVVVPVTAAYPVVTLLLAAAVLAEALTVGRVVGVALVVGGVVVLTTAG
jgi:transporter family protein